MSAQRAWIRVATWLLAVGAAAALHAQALEVQESSGTVEAFLPDLGWRQAVVGRPLPADSVLTSWVGSKARVGFADSTCTVDALTDVRVQAVSDQLVRLSLLAGGITVQTGAVPYEIEFRGVTVRVEGGEASLSDGVLTLRSGTSVVTGAGGTPLPLKPGAVLDLLSRNEGPVFR